MEITIKNIQKFLSVFLKSFFFLKKAPILDFCKDPYKRGLHNLSFSLKSLDTKFHVLKSSYKISF